MCFAWCSINRKKKKRKNQDRLESTDHQSPSVLQTDEDAHAVSMPHALTVMLTRKTKRGWVSRRVKADTLRGQVQ
jgi:hypothetical protein